MEEVAQEIRYEVELIIDGGAVKETVELYFDRHVEPLIEIRRIH